MLFKLSLIAVMAITGSMTFSTADFNGLIANFKVCPDDKLDSSHVWECVGCPQQMAYLRFYGVDGCIVRRSCGQGYKRDCSECVFDKSNSTECVGNVVDAQVMDTVTCQKVSEDGIENADDRVEGVCSILHRKYRTCDASNVRYKRVHWYYIGSKFFFADNLSTRHNQNVKDPTSYHCVAPGGVNCIRSVNCFKGKCKGDKAFCDMWGCDGEEDCTCVFNSTSGWTEILTPEGMVIVPKCYGSSVLKVNVPVARHELSLGDFICKDCDFSCSPKGVTLILTNRSPGTYRVCRNPYCISGKLNQTPMDITLPYEMMLSEGDTSIEIWQNDYKSSLRMSKRCHSVSLCDTLDCEWCWIRYKNPRCFLFIHWLVISVLVLVVLILVGIILGSLSRLLSLLWIPAMILGVVGKSMRWIGKVLIYWTRKAKRGLDPDPEQGNINRRVLRPQKPILFLLATLMVVGSDACSFTSTLIAEHSNCIYNAKGLSECSISVSTRLSVAPVGQTSCLLVKDPNGKFLGTLKLENKAVTLMCQKESLYFVPEAEAKCHSHKNCRSVGDCEGDNCEDWTYGKAIRGQPEEASYTGWSGCTRTCGCASCGCFLCAQGCTFWRKYFITPTL